MIYKTKLAALFLEWYKQTNPHLYEKGVTKKERDNEIEEYVNDVLSEHMETMTAYEEDDSDGSTDYNNAENNGL